MKNYSLLIGLLLLCACKTRHVNTTKTNMIKQSLKTEVQQSNLLCIDTIKSVAHIVSQKLHQDSFAIEIVPDTGIIHIVNGDYIGKAHSIVIKSSSASLQNTDLAMQQNKSEITQSTLNDSTTQQSNKQLYIKAKQSSATIVGFWFYLIACVLILGAMYFTRVKHWF